jgi:uridine phosphorylase
VPAEGLPADVLVCGDPARATLISAHFQRPECVSERREYRYYRGTFAGRPVAVCSHGVGAAGAAPAFEELIRAGARRLIRVGTCGGLQPDLAPGDLVIATAAVQNTGFGREYLPAGFPAVADPDLILALRRATLDLGHEAREGIVLSRDRFYPGVELPENPNYAQLSAANVMAVEMECAALFLVATMRRARSAAILAVDGNVLAAAEAIDTYRPRQPVVRAAVEAAIDIALRVLAPLDDDPR